MAAGSGLPAAALGVPELEVKAASSEARGAAGLVEELALTGSFSASGTVRVLSGDVGTC